VSPAAGSVDVFDLEGNKSGSVDLPPQIFDVDVNVALIHQVVVAQQAAARQGTHATLSRAEVSGGGRKPHRQKGTGRARQGSIRAPQFTGGGSVNGPKPRRYDQRTPKKMKAAALRGALSDRARTGRLHIVEGLVDGDSPSTKTARAALGRLTQRPRVLVVLARGDEVTWLSLRNVDTIHLIAADQLNTYDVLVSDDVVFTRSAYDAFVAGKVDGAPEGASDGATEQPAEGTADPVPAEPDEPESDRTADEPEEAAS
jgi:large subunit ribosomal protein L4